MTQDDTLPYRRFWRRFSLVCLGLLLLAGAGAGQSLATAIASTGWKQTTGKVLGSSLEQRRVKFWTYSAAVIRVSYTGNGYLKFGTAVSAFDFWGGRGIAEELVARFPVGDSVPIAFNPNDPSEAYLQTGFRWAYMSTVVAFLPGVAILAMAMAGVLRRLPPGTKMVGQYLAFEAPLPRLVLLRFTAFQVAMIWTAVASGAGVVAMYLMGSFTPQWDGRTMIPPGLNPGPGDLPWTVLAMPVVAVIAGVIGWYTGHAAETSYEREVVIDVDHDLLVGAKTASGERPTLPLRELDGLRIRKVVTNNGKHQTTVYEVWIVSSENAMIHLLSCQSREHALAVHAWIDQHVTAGGYGPVKVVEIDG